MRSIAKQSGISASPPIFDWTGSRALVRPNIDLRDDFRLDLASRRERYVEADIRAFFHSIYTHAIPWAIYGKSWAKQPANRGPEHYGNLLDLLCRNAQDGQTIGLPVGPDTSRLIAEVIASAVDVDVRQRLSVTARDASRYVDDYTIGADDGQSGESIIAAIRQAAAVFELELNNEKSAIHPTSVRLSTGWKQAVLAHIPRHGPTVDEFQRFFYEVGRVCHEHPEINVEKFAFQNARLAFIDVDEWKTIQNTLVNAYRRNPSLVSFLVEILILRDVERNDVDRENLQGFLERRFSTLAEENRSGEIIWLLFLALRLNIELPAARLAPVVQIENALVAILVTAAASRGLVVGNVDFSLWNRSLNADGLRSPMWLYAYESVRQGYNALPGPNFITQDDFFGPLLARRVSFLSIEGGFTSIATYLRDRRGDNERRQRLREDFGVDFEFDLDELDDDDVFEHEVDIY